MKTIIVSVLSLVIFAGAARADLSPVAFTGFTANNNGNQQTIGYQFSFSKPVVVSALSYFDNGSDGLGSLHTVGIFDANGNLLTSATIPIGTLTPIQDGFRYVTLASSIQLAPGTYYVGGTSGGTVGLDSYAQAATGVTFGANLTYLAAVYAADGTGNTLTFPSNIDQFGPGYGFYGGSFLYSVVPEPSAWAFVLAAAGCLLGWRGFRPRHAARLAAGLVFLAAASAARAQSSGDELHWAGGTDHSSWVDPSAVWNDASNATVGKISISTSTSNSYNFVFGGNDAYGTVAPNTMSLDPGTQSSNNLTTNLISFFDGFAAGNNMTLGRAETTDLLTTLNLTSGWQIGDRASSGTINFVQYTAYGVSTGNFGGLYFNVSGSGNVVAATGTNVVLNVEISGSGSLGISKPPTDTGVGGVVTLMPPNGNGNPYTGGTTVSSGTLVLAGGSTVASATGSGALTVNSGGTLAGSGFGLSTTTVNSGGILSPGTAASPVGILHLGNGGLGSGVTINGQYTVNIVGGGTTAGVNNDQTVVTGALTLNPTSSTLVVNAANPAGLVKNQVFYLTLDGGSTPVVGTFEGLANGATVTDSAGDTYTISYFGNGDGGTLGNDISLTVTGVAPVPEPATLLGGLVTVGLLVPAFLRRRKSARPSAPLRSR